MKITDARAYAPGNIYSRFAVVRLELSHGDAPDMSSPPEIGRQIVEMVPTVGDIRRDIFDFPAWRRLLRGDREVTGTLIVEVLGLLLQRWNHWPVSFSGFEADREIRGGAAIFETRNVHIGRLASEHAVRLFNRLQGAPQERLEDVFQDGFDAFSKQSAAVPLGFAVGTMAARAELRGVPWSVGRRVPVFRLGQGKYSNFMFGAQSSEESAIGARFASHKPTATALLSNVGLPVAAQRTAVNANQAIQAARQIGFPVVVKPASGSRGRGVTVGAVNENQVGEAFVHARAATAEGEVVVEAMIAGNEHRLLVLNGKFLAASWRRPAQIVGDGVTTVNEIIDRENSSPARRSKRHSTLKPLLVDGMTQSCLAEQGFSLSSVPQSGTVVFLRKASNVSMGGTPVDVTDTVHPSVQEVAVRAAAALGIKICGVDFITSDISRPYWETGGAICEVNTQPGLETHMSVVEGTPRDVADAIVSSLYPEGSPGRVRMVAILTESENIGLQDSIRIGALKAGRMVGLASSVGATIGAHGISVAFPHLRDAVEAVTLDRTVDAGIAVATPKEIVEIGLGVDRIDLAILPSGERSALTEQACEVLSRLADGRVITENAPDVLERALESLSVESVGVETAGSGPSGEPCGETDPDSELISNPPAAPANPDS